MIYKPDELDSKKIYWIIEHMEREKDPTPPALPEAKQEIFTRLCTLTGNDYIEELNRLRQ